jgi:hypothetical protein
MMSPDGGERSARASVGREFDEVSSIVWIAQ